MSKPSRVEKLRPRRPVVAEAVARRLEEAADARGDGVAGARGAKPAPPAGTLDAPRTRRDGTQTRSTSMQMPIDLGRRLRLHCASHGVKQNDVIVAALERLLADAAGPAADN